MIVAQMVTEYYLLERLFSYSERSTVHYSFQLAVSHLWCCLGFKHQSDSVPSIGCLFYLRSHFILGVFFF